MFNDKPLHFVSIEGNWEKNIHEDRIANAAIALTENENSFAIASGTNSPPEYASFFNGKLGVYTRNVLMYDYNIPAMRIIPAFLFPYRLTYTIIDAFTNSSIIGWVSCGLRKQATKIKVFFEPNTSPFHLNRVELVNNKACEYLKSLNVDVNLICNDKTTKIEMDNYSREESVRLSALHAKGGLLDTGKWLDNGINRHFGDINNMKNDLFEAFNATFSSLSFNKSDILKDLERLVFILLWNIYSNSKAVSNKDLEGIFYFIERNYNMTLLETDAACRITNFVKSIVS